MTVVSGGGGIPLVVGGALANKPRNGGEAWVRLSWAVGLRRLGFDVYFLEQIAPGTCVDEGGAVTDFECSVNRRYFDQVMEQFGFQDRSILVLTGTERTSGLPFPALMEVAGKARLLVNISGHVAIEPLMRRFRRKAYIDVDPGFTQFWHASGTGGARLEGHDCFFTVGENIGTPDCPIPTRGIVWRAVPPPVVIGDWPVPEEEGDAFTTVASWRPPFGRVEFGGKTFGLKVHEFRKFITIPAVSGHQFEVALDIHPDDAGDRRALVENGWRISDPVEVARDPFSFRSFVGASRAEFSVAQGIYVETGSGWFSDRTVRYLASGRPAVVQDTGFGRNYPLGEGLLAFRTLEDARRSTQAVAADYPLHRRRARELAEEFFDSDKVLARVIEQSEAL
jgi:hypothetical protein